MRLSLRSALFAATLGALAACGGGGGGGGGGGVTPSTPSPGPTCNSTPSAPCFGASGGTAPLPSVDGLTASLSIPSGQIGALSVSATVATVPPASVTWQRPAPFAAPTLYLTLAKTSGPAQLIGDASIAIAASSFPSGTTSLQMLYFADGASGTSPLSATSPPIILIASLSNAAFAFNLPFGAFSGTVAFAPMSASAPSNCAALSFGYACTSPGAKAGTTLAVAINVVDPTATIPAGSAATILAACVGTNQLQFSNAANPSQPNTLSVTTSNITPITKTLATTIAFMLPIRCDFLAPATLFGQNFWFAGSVDLSAALPPPPVMNDDWTTYAHDDQRTGFEPTSPITPANIAELNLAWRQSWTNLDANCATFAQTAHVFVEEASPLVSGGVVYVADVCGKVSALRRDTGDIAWQTQLPLAKDYGNTVTPVAAVSGVYGTPTLDSATNTLLVPVEGIYGQCPLPFTPATCPDYAHGGYLAALDATSGAIKWEAPAVGGSPGLAKGNMRGEPIVINGTVIEGVSGGDPDSGNVQGGLISLNEATGATITSYTIAPPTSSSYPYDGGSSWGPISYDGSSLYTGTGNTVDGTASPTNDGAFDSVIQFSPSTLTPNSSFIQTYNNNADDDVGGGVLLWGANLYFTGKSGYFYGYPIYQPAMQLFATLITTHSPPGGFGGIGTPTTDGTVIAVSSGYNAGSVQSDLDVFPVGSGVQSCALHAMNSSLFSYVAWIPGIGFTPLDNQVAAGQPGDMPTFVAFNDSCTLLWQALPTDVLQYFYAGPAVVASGVYAVDIAGNVYSWKLPTMVGIQAMERHDLIRPAPQVHFDYRHFVPKSAVSHRY